MNYLESSWTDPAMNLALEQYAFDTLALNNEYFMLWRNHNAVIIGLHQNTAEEVDLSYAEQEKIKIVRRLSGGGAVFHDLGNLNFTYIVNTESAETINNGRFTQQIANALRSLGVDPVLSGRNDMTIDGCKFSGNASYFRDGRLMHHGTLLFDTDLDKMTNVLRVPDDKIDSKGIASVRSRVTNIRNHLQQKITMDEFWAHLHNSIAVDLPSYMPTEQDIAAVNLIKRERYATWEWNFGRSPGYSINKRRRINGFGAIHIGMEITDGKIAAFRTDGDYFGDKTCEDIASALIGARLESDALHAILSKHTLSEYYRGLEVDEFVRLIMD